MELKEKEQKQELTQQTRQHYDSDDTDDSVPISRLSGKRASISETQSDSSEGTPLILVIEQHMQIQQKSKKGYRERKRKANIQICRGNEEESCIKKEKR